MENMLADVRCRGRSAEGHDAALRVPIAPTLRRDVLAGDDAAA
jgi:hypothetical protein